MIGKVRKFIRNSSPDWLNVEVNKDFFTNFSAALTSDHESEELEVRSEELETNSVGSAYSYGVLPLPTSSAPEAPSAFPFKGRPHWRRIKQVFEVLEEAGTGTYTELVNYVRATTGTGCSRKLISKWKKVRSQNNERSEVPAFSFVEQQESELSQLSALGVSSIISSDCQSIEPSPSPPVSPSPRLPLSSSPHQAWSYLAATAIVVGLVGFDWLQPQSQNGENTIQVAVAQEAASPSSPVPPKPKARRSEPRNIKISLTLSSPQDLKVKQGDEVVKGQVLSDRTSERSRLLARKKQLELSLEKLNLPLPPITPSKPIPALSKLPPVSYQEEEANIKLKHQELGKAEKAIANQEEKIRQIQELRSKSEVTIQNSSPKLELIIEHEQAVLENLRRASEEAQVQLEIAQAKLNSAKEQRAYSEYQRQLEETRRALAIEQQQLELERQRANRAQQLTEREYSKAQIAAQIQEIDAQISQLGTVKAPYEGTIKKVKWTGQSNHALSVELTLAVSSQQSAVTSQQ